MAAIPAVVFYNKFSADSAQICQRLEAFADEFAAIVSRQIDVQELTTSGREASRLSMAKHRARRRRRRARSPSPPMSEINVTPMVDVMLVLLIIFMVAAPLLTVGVPIELPQAKGKQLEAKQRAARHHGQGQWRCLHRRDAGEARRVGGQVEGHRQAKAKTSRSSCAATKASATASVMRVMGRISAGGFKKVSLITEVEEGG